MVNVREGFDKSTAQLNYEGGHTRLVEENYRLEETADPNQFFVVNLTTKTKHVLTRIPEDKVPCTKGHVL